MFIKLTKSIGETKRPIRVNPSQLSLYERENDDETSPDYYKSYIYVVGFGCITVDESIETIDKMIEAISCTHK